MLNIPPLFRTPEDFEVAVRKCKPLLSFIAFLPTLAASPHGKNQWHMTGEIQDIKDLEATHTQLAKYATDITLEPLESDTSIALCSLIIHATSIDVIKNFIDRYKAQNRIDRFYEKSRMAGGKPMSMTYEQETFEVTIPHASPPRKLSSFKFVSWSRYHPYYRH